MAAVRFVEPVVRFCAVITRHEILQEQAIEQIAKHWGSPVIHSPAIDFEAGGFYAATMGSELKKILVAFDGFVDPGSLADWKLQTNHWEADWVKEPGYPKPNYPEPNCSEPNCSEPNCSKPNCSEPNCSEPNCSEPRPLNLDPGYMSQAKLVLATTKDRDHRIYLRDGIFAEVTLTYVGKKWEHHRWSYPSYRTEAVARFASECRIRLRKHLQETKAFRIG